MKRCIALVIILCIFLTGCLKPNPLIQYPSLVAWNDIMYEISEEEVPKDSLGKQVGKTTRVANPLPLRNGDSNAVWFNSKIYEIKDTDTSCSIAIQVRDKICKANRTSSLKK